jgi:hypothetical protein
MREGQEMTPHVPEAELEINEVRMNEHIRGGNHTTNKVVPRLGYK